MVWQNFDLFLAVIRPANIQQVNICQLFQVRIILELFDRRTLRIKPYHLLLRLFPLRHWRQGCFDVYDRFNLRCFLLERKWLCNYLKVLLSMLIWLLLFFILNHFIFWYCFQGCLFYHSRLKLGLLHGVITLVNWW